MAIAAAMVFEVRTTGADTNGGGFKAGASGTDYSQQDAAQFSGTDLVIDAVTNTKVTSAGHNFVATDVGNIIQISAGTSWTTGFYEILSVASNAATLDRSPGATGLTGGTWAEGGALASPGKAGAAHVGSNAIWVKAGTYTMTTTSSNVANGRVTLTAGTQTNNPTILRGYTTSRGDESTKPILRAGITGLTMVTTGTYGIVENFEFDGVRGTYANSAAASISRGCVLRNCYIHACIDGGGTRAVNASTGVLEDVYIYDCTSTSTGGIVQNGTFLYHVVINACSVSGNNTCVFETSAGICERCIASNNTGNGFQLAQTTAGGTNIAIDCVAYTNTRSGFFASHAEMGWAENCISTGNTRYGFESASASNQHLLRNCATYNNTLGATTNFNDTRGMITLSGTPFTNAGSLDFSLNATPGAGAALRGTGYGAIGTVLSSTVGYPDVGAVQHQDSGSTSSGGRIIGGGL